MTTPRASGVEIERVRANPAGAYITVAGVVIFNVAVFFEWASSDGDGFSGYEADSLWPYAAYLGIGFAVALLYAASRAYRRQHRGLSLASMAVGLATLLQCVAWLVDVPGAAERQSELNADVGVWIGLVGAAIWAIGSGLLAKEPEGDPEHDRIRTGTDAVDRDRGPAGGLDR
ncbi:hypothetical protein [Geodermatophilus sp. DSM 44513]|uniref:hypothetical protein n=1 Tax=Geodermatophilus sp. DSM 44513 TaxID=1528104 RepID=UPI001288CAED|nr:hypothetical protein [Geodermatophilus sp. DSM 44513]WNV75242.1 hypothetical protein RTG05_20000 [Geodermatophilus sp. DSM 44513]